MEEEEDESQIENDNCNHSTVTTVHFEDSDSMVLNEAKKPTKTLPASHNLESEKLLLECDNDVLRNKNSLQVLIRAAKMMNPKQFQLPNELMPSVQLPGTSKKINPITSRASNKRPPHELDNGLVPLPVKLCFQCSRSCRKAPLIQCDYCPLLFHPDCLDPPLTVLPTGRWMCPNHPEPTLEQKLLTSLSLTERVKLLDKFSGHLSQDSVKMEFLKKVHKINPPYRCKEFKSEMIRVVVPNAIKEFYKNPPSLLPKSACYLYCGSEEIRQISSKDTCSNVTSKPTTEEQEEWLTSIIDFQISVAKHLAQKEKRKPNTLSPEIPAATSIQLNKGTNNNSNLNQTIDTSKGNNQILRNGPLNCKSEYDIEKELFKCKSEDVDKNLSNNEDTNSKSFQTGVSNKIFSNKRLSFSHKFGNSNSAILNLNNTTNSYIEDVNDVELSKLDDKLIRILAWQRLQQLLPNGKSLTNTNENPMNSPHTTVKRICLGDVKARAVLCPVFIRTNNGSINTNSGGPAIAMSYRTLSIGTGEDNDVVLGNYGYCNYVSSRHACIFFDEVSFRFSPHVLIFFFF